ncbi:MAG: hypothetical protein M3014_15445 [Chloroflexota bacterium]|nr:hypothetical protein [Chloroflexota bacterium]
METNVPPPSFKFISLPLAAERLGTTRSQILQWVEEGRIKTVSGSGQQSAFRTADIEALAQEMGLASTSHAAEQTTLETDEAEESTSPTARRKPRDPVKLIGTRISMDSRWAEISDEDIAAWLDALEPVQFARVRKVAQLARERLEKVLSLMDSLESAGGSSTPLRPR